jgi:hypothetical protein
MQQEEPAVTRDKYEWVWTVRAVQESKGEKVPMARGDRLFIKISADNKASFHHRDAGADRNSGLWNKAEGMFCDDTGTLSGSLPDGTTFSMTLTPGGKESTIRCRHKRNPEQGEWDADDGIGN